MDCKMGIWKGSGDLALLDSSLIEILTDSSSEEESSVMAGSVDRGDRREGPSIANSVVKLMGTSGDVIWIVDNETASDEGELPEELLMPSVVAGSSSGDSGISRFGSAGTGLRLIPSISSGSESGISCLEAEERKLAPLANSQGGVKCGSCPSVCDTCVSCSTCIGSSAISSPVLSVPSSRVNSADASSLRQCTLENIRLHDLSYREQHAQGGSYDHQLDESSSLPLTTLSPALGRPRGGPKKTVKLSVNTSNDITLVGSSSMQLQESRLCSGEECAELVSYSTGQQSPEQFEGFTPSRLHRPRNRWLKQQAVMAATQRRDPTLSRADSALWRLRELAALSAINLPPNSGDPQLVVKRAMTCVSENSVLDNGQGKSTGPYLMDTKETLTLHTSEIVPELFALPRVSCGVKPGLRGDSSTISKTTLWKSCDILPGNTVCVASEIVPKRAAKYGVLQDRGIMDSSSSSANMNVVKAGNKTALYTDKQSDNPEILNSSCGHCNTRGSAEASAQEMVSSNDAFGTRADDIGSGRDSLSRNQQLHVRNQGAETSSGVQYMPTYTSLMPDQEKCHLKGAYMSVLNLRHVDAPVPVAPPPRTMRERLRKRRQPQQRSPEHEPAAVSTLAAHSRGPTLMRRRTVPLAATGASDSSGEDIIGGTSSMASQRRRRRLLDFSELILPPDTVDPSESYRDNLQPPQLHAESGTSVSQPGSSTADKEYSPPRLERQRLPRAGNARCRICRLFIPRVLMPLHLRVHRTGYRGCDVCGTVFSSDTTLYRHRLSHEYGSHQCPCCGCEYDTAARLEKHRATAHRSRSREQMVVKKVPPSPSRTSGTHRDLGKSSLLDLGETIGRQHSPSVLGAKSSDSLNLATATSERAAFVQYGPVKIASERLGPCGMPLPTSLLSHTQSKDSCAAPQTHRCKTGSKCSSESECVVPHKRNGDGGTAEPPLLQHGRERSHTCLDCGKNFLMVFNLNMHRRLVHSMSGGTSRIGKGDGESKDAGITASGDADPMFICVDAGDALSLDMCPELYAL